MIINRIGPLSFAKLSAVLYAMMGLVVGGIFSLVAFVGGFASDTEGPTAFGGMISAAAIVVFPFLYGAMGFVVTLVGAWLYNLAAGIVGGVEVDIR
jgi:hypothetical protein